MTDQDRSDTFTMFVKEVLRAVSDSNTPEVGSPIPIPRPLDTSALSDLFGAMGQDYVPKAVVMAAARFSDLRRHDREWLDIETHASLIQVGVQGYLYGCPIIVPGPGTSISKIWVMGRVINGWGWIKQEGTIQFS